MPRRSGTTAVPPAPDEHTQEARPGAEPVEAVPLQIPHAQAEHLARLLNLTERREPTVAQVATWIGLGIIEGRLRPGQDLNSVELAGRFQTSRTPVREALMLLEQEGLVEIRARKRPRVASFSMERIRQVYEVRQHLLALAGRLVATQVSDDELADLEARVQQMRSDADNGEIDSYFWGHVALQQRMTEIAGNTVLKSIIDSLALRTLVFRHQSLSQPGRLRESFADQELIFRSIKDRDPEMTAMLLSRATQAAFKAIARSDWRWMDEKDGLVVQVAMREPGEA